MAGYTPPPRKPKPPTPNPVPVGKAPKPKRPVTKLPSSTGRIGQPVVKIQPVTPGKVPMSGTKEKRAKKFR